ncbi:MAG: SIS domain-containing protein [Acidobacteriota bacterium]
MLTRLLEDILRQPNALNGCLHHLGGTSKTLLERAATLLVDAPRVHVVGIGSSWNAGLAVNSALQRAGLSSCLFDASELLHFGPFPKDTTVLVLSRSGRSVEIVRLIDKVRSSNSAIIAITNTPDSPLALAADVCIDLKATFDHLVSVVMYSGLVLAGSLIAARIRAELSEQLIDVLALVLERTDGYLSAWREQIDHCGWLKSDAPTYFLARGPSLASAHQARLLWEEAAKMPASSLSTGGFRHGSQEMVWPGSRAAMWIDPSRQRDEDLRLAADLHSAGALVLLIGQQLPASNGNVVINLPVIPEGWQCLVDIIPAQLAAERLARLRGVDCGAFRLCQYIVEQEGGLGIPSSNNRSIEGS